MEGRWTNCTDHATVSNVRVHRAGGGVSRQQQRSGGGKKVEPTAGIWLFSHWLVAEPVVAKYLCIAVSYWRFITDSTQPPAPPAGWRAGAEWAAAPGTYAQPAASCRHQLLGTARRMNRYETVQELHSTFGHINPLMLSCVEAGGVMCLYVGLGTAVTHTHTHKQTN